MRHIADEIQRRGAHEIFIILLVCLEPLAGVVRGEGREEGEGWFGEVMIGHCIDSVLIYGQDDSLVRLYEAHIRCLYGYSSMFMHL